MPANYVLPPSNVKTTCVIELPANGSLRCETIAMWQVQRPLTNEWVRAYAHKAFELVTLADVQTLVEQYGRERVRACTLVTYTVLVETAPPG